MWQLQPRHASALAKLLIELRLGSLDGVGNEHRDCPSNVWP